MKGFLINLKSKFSVQFFMQSNIIIRKMKFKALKQQKWNEIKRRRKREEIRYEYSKSIFLLILSILRMKQYRCWIFFTILIMNEKGQGYFLLFLLLLLNAVLANIAQLFVHFDTWYVDTAFNLWILLSWL